MSVLVLVLLAIVLFGIMHLSVMALCAQAMGIGVTVVSFGMGPVVVRGRVVQWKLLPLGGNVRLAMSALEGKALEGKTQAGKAQAVHMGFDMCFDTQPRWKRVLLPLSGIGATVLLAALVLGGAAGGSVLRGFGQIVSGALQPLSAGQDLLAGLQAGAARLVPVVLMATLWCKLAAFNLLPFLGSNGTQALTAALVPEAARNRLEAGLAPLLLVFGCVLLGGWLVALVAHFAHLA